MKKHITKIASSLLLITLGFSLGLNIYNIRASNILQSTGKLIYTNPETSEPEVIIDTNDFQVLQDNINNLPGFIDTNNVTKNPFNATTEWEPHTNSFTATTDGWLYAVLGINSDSSAKIFINNMQIFTRQGNLYRDNTIWTSQLIPIKKGQVVKFESDGSCYIANSYFYGMQ